MNITIIWKKIYFYIKIEATFVIRGNCTASEMFEKSNEPIKSNNCPDDNLGKIPGLQCRGSRLDRLQRERWKAAIGLQET